MSISIRAYARQCGVSEAAVRKAIKSGRISIDANGGVDPSTADHQWEANRVRAKPISTVIQQATQRGEGVASTGTGATLLQARTTNEVLKAQTAKVRLAKMKSELVDRAQAMAYVFKLARAERDAWLNWPARVAPTMAADLSVDLHALHLALENAVRDQLTHLGEIRLRID